MGPENCLKMRPDNELLLEESPGEEQSPSDQTDDHCPVLSYHFNGNIHHDLEDTKCKRPSDHNDLTKNFCHSSFMIEKPSRSIIMEPQVSSNGWGDHHDTTLLAKQKSAHQFSNGSSKNSVSSKVKLDINKNHHCEQPADAAQANSTMLQPNSNHKMLSEGTANGIIPHQNSNNIPSNTNVCKNSQVKPISIANGTSNKRSHSSSKSEMYEDAPYHIVLMCYLSYVVLTVFGYLRDFMRKTGLEKNSAVERNREGYPRLYKSFESFYTRNIYCRIRDCWNRPIASVPGAYLDLVDRISNDYNWTFETPGTTHRIVNMGSYNYLGFAENSGPIHEQILETLKSNAVGVCSAASELGTNNTVQELESLMAQFLGVESCIVFGMGFATNSTNIACFAKKGCLIVSDELNHASLILGCRLSGATIRVFKHNDMNDLERKIRKYVVEGQPKTHRPWKKIIILVEGVYSMEGTIVNLPELIRIKKRYKCYIYLDEAHSIGALGQHGRGVVDYYNCDPRDVDVLMGTFTKSFGSAGGYLAGRKELVDHIRANSFSYTYANSMSAVVAKQIYCVVQVLMGLDGTDQGSKRIAQLSRNTRYFRRKLSQLGFIVYGNDDSPVVPLMLVFCPKIACVIRLALEKGLGFIGAGFPATALTAGRVRFCISASHTKEMLDRSLEVMNEIGDQIGIKYSRHPRETCSISYDEV